jgi:hypothetical protein
MENPLIKTQELVVPPPKYPITVKCVVDSLSDKIPENLKIREFSHNMNINFMTREYNSMKYSDDRDYITRLPAFHIYVHGGYRKTFFINTRPYQIIQEIVQEYEEAQERKRLRRTWRTFYTELRTYLKSIFKRKTAMEKYQEEQDYQKERRRVREWS